MTTDWKSVAEFAGIIAIVASLVFVGMEMRQAQGIAMSDGALANAANEIERYGAINDHPDIWIRGSSGDELNDSDALVFRNLVQIVHTAEFMEMVRLSRVGAEEISNAVTADFSAFLFENPGARRVWLEDREKTKSYRSLLAPDRVAIEDEFVSNVKLQLTKLDQLQD